MANNNKHTIILMQTAQSKATRTFMDYGSISQAMDGTLFIFAIVNSFCCLCRKFPFCYDISNLYNFIDGLADFSALVYEPSLQAYLPYDREWIKHKTLQHLKKLAQTE
ncbi:enhancer of rudimentary homolog [Carica papaya]|uniref:enhancer of rudimentary homolog n=1 Tax=Carica papaya TaxID=3649 RepID=UPI000B8C7506|nr:enhancer of rudimentary homolog [Carica papaya]